MRRAWVRDGHVRFHTCREHEYKRVAPNAILNAGGRADEVRCHPGTREEVIDRIEKWGGTQDGQTAPVFWLSGPAGAGKSAIVQTVAERCDERKVPHANFFFFRGDSSRSHASPLVATLLHQIILLYPSLQGHVAVILFTDRFIFDSVLKTQLSKLIVAPLRTIQQSTSDYHPLMLLIDGLDECDSESKLSQQQILRTFDRVLAEQPCPLRLLVASCDKSQIQAAFNKMSLPCLQLYLDEKYSPESDIRLFVNAQLEQVRQTHPLAHTLDATWPSIMDVNNLVWKSSGQFVYAATVMRFISDSSASPMLSLERVHGAARLATKSPFSHLDALYTYILSQVDDQEALKDILHAQLSNTEGNLSLINILQLYNRRYTRVTVLSCLADITPIAKFKHNSNKMVFHHASFSDYLLDQSRSEDYFVDLAAFFYNILPIVWKYVIDSKNAVTGMSWASYGVNGLMKLDKLPPGLTDMLVIGKWLLCYVIKPTWTSVFKTIFDLCATESDVRNCRHIIREWFNSINCRVQDGLGDLEARIPFSHRYFEMKLAPFHCNQTPGPDVFDALCPETEFDQHESALWLNGLLHKLYAEHSGNTQNHEHLLDTWISWAVQNDISCDGLDDIPSARLYL
ncbi:hypothetical protein D9619_011178 [Psilocybe cf. subviscida]|uniref:NACHT domain-containing protein n=1 Tax=Psilocybe cf. subviscida TaxID=2480587 RepID=A0A8H5BJ90_9AGAR|nr:hypothetical protein D9619_011178 [Psilocybe cf. subviscida]